MNKYFAIAMAGVAMAAMGGTAQAATTFTATSINTVYSNAPTGDVNKTSSPTEDVNNAILSPQSITGKFSNDPTKAVTLFGYCVDIFQNSAPTTFKVVTLSDYLGSGKTTQYNLITALIAAEGDDKSKTHDAAMQAAIWELLYETKSTYDIDRSGYGAQFYVDDVKNGSGVLSEADQLLQLAVANAGKPTTGYSFYVLQSDTKQDLLYWTYTPPAVPEPATWGMMLLGMGAIGHSMRSRRRKMAVSFG